MSACPVRMPEGRVYLASILFSAISAVVYAQVELWLSWEKVQQAFSSVPSLGAIPPYNLIFTTLFFLLLAFGPLIPFMGKRAFIVGVGNFLLICVVEDASYFLLSGRWMTQADYTAKLLGAVEFGGVLVPMWYIVYLAVALYLYSKAL